MPELTQTREKRCTGHCCRDIVLSHSREELESGHTVDGRVIEEAAHVRHILCDPWWSNKDGRWHYSCRYLMDCGDCAIFRSRPSMCQVYPSNGRCSEHGCTSGFARGAEVVNQSWWCDD